MWPTLEKSDHWPVLKYLIDTCKLNYECKTLLDVGCGAAALSEHVALDYTGCDLPNIVENVAMVRNPDNKYVKFDIEHSDLTFMKNYDVVVMNAFIDVLENPMAALDRVLSVASKFVICHRQKLGEITAVEKVPSYTGFSYGTTLGAKDVKECLEKHGFATVANYPSIGNYYSFLLVKT